MDPGSGRLAEHILATMREALGLSIGTVQVERPGEDPAWRIDAVNQCGERWAAEHPDFYRAAVMLAELIGFELEE